MNCTDCAWFNDIERPAVRNERCATCADIFDKYVADGTIVIDGEEDNNV